MPSGDNSGVTYVQPGKSRAATDGPRGHASFPPFEPLSTEHWQKRFILIGRIRIRAYLLLVTTYSFL